MPGGRFLNDPAALSGLFRSTKEQWICGMLFYVPVPSKHAGSLGFWFQTRLQYHSDMFSVTGPASTHALFTRDTLRCNQYHQTILSSVYWPRPGVAGMLTARQFHKITGNDAPVSRNIARSYCAIRVSVDVLFAIHDGSLGFSPVTSYSGVKTTQHVASESCGFPQADLKQCCSLWLCPKR